VPCALDLELLRRILDDQVRRGEHFLQLRRELDAAQE
jgi:hypothetical protein